MKTIVYNKATYELREYTLKSYYLWSYTTCPFCGDWILIAGRQRGGCTRMCACGTKFLDIPIDGKYYARSPVPVGVKPPVQYIENKP